MSRDRHIPDATALLREHHEDKQQPAGPSTQTFHEDDVVRGRRTRDGEPLAIVRPGEILDAALGETREWMR
jgi:hypothetical protein